MAIPRNGASPQLSDPPRTLTACLGMHAFHTERCNPFVIVDVPRTNIRTFRVRKMDPPRITAGPSAYFLRTFRVPLNRKQEMHVFTSELVTTRVDACGFGGTVENGE